MTITHFLYCEISLQYTTMLIINHKNFLSKSLAAVKEYWICDIELQRPKIRYCSGHHSF